MLKEDKIGRYLSFIVFDVILKWLTVLKYGSHMNFLWKSDFSRCNRTVLVVVYKAFFLCARSNLGCIMVWCCASVRPRTISFPDNNLCKAKNQLLIWCADARYKNTDQVRICYHFIDSLQSYAPFLLQIH